MNEQDPDKLFSLVREDRLRVSTQGARGVLIASESDKARVINCGAFRRLQQKAQVFPLEPNASVRSRLTHSIEVSQIGRHLAQMIIQEFHGTKDGYEKFAAFVNTVETACLLHDIGNPPFGHLGESAIKEWFRENEDVVDSQDLREFDGNPQGLRMISFLAGADSYGLNLTASQILSTVKYPWDCSRKPNGKKIGVFSSDFNCYRSACEKLSWSIGDKFPFMLLMDTADEIAYSMSDLEDGLEKKIVSEDLLKHEFGAGRFSSSSLKPFVAFKVGVINEAVSTAAKQFCEQLGLILSGGGVDLISSSSEIGGVLGAVKRFAGDKIYSHESAERIELAGRAVVKGLLRHFGELLKLPEDDFLVLFNGGDRTAVKSKGLEFHLRMFRLLPIGYVDKYKDGSRGEEKLRRAHLVVDFISGMTDDYALELYQVLEGIRIK
jgi:dGTPase